MDRLEDLVRLAGDKAEEFVLTSARVPGGTAVSSPRRPDAGKEGEGARCRQLRTSARRGRLPFAFSGASGSSSYSQNAVQATSNGS